MLNNVKLKPMTQKNRTVVNKAKKGFPINSNTILHSSFLMILTVCSFITACVIISNFAKLLTKSNTASYPTSIPWITDKRECEYNNKYWRDNQCWDKEHSSSF